MKKFLLLIFVFITTVLSAQSGGGDVVYLKNGSVIKGTIIKNLSDSTIAIKTQDGSLFVFNNREVARTLINNAAPSNNPGRYNHINNLWVGFNLEPQFQNIFKSPNEAQALLVQNNESRQLPGSGGVQLGIKIYYLPWGLAGFETGLQYHFYQSREIFSEPYNGVTEYSNRTNQFHNLEIPLLINVHSRGKKVRFYSSDGFSAGVTLGAHHAVSNYASGYTGWDTSFVTPADSTTTIYATVLVSAGVQISLAHNILFNLTAAFRLSTGGVLGATNPSYAPNPYPFFPYSIGLNVEILLHTPTGMRKATGDFAGLTETINPYEQEQKNLDRAKAIHQSWNNCVVIMANGDTVKAQVQKSADYRLTGGLFTRGKVLIAHPDGSEEKIRANQLFELYIPAEDSGYRKYITLIENEETESRKVYRVVVDGKCQLLSQNISGSTPPLGVAEDDVEKFYIYYKDTLTPIDFNKKQEFINKFKVLFAECPKLTGEIENHFNQLGNTGNLVEEFNKCIGSRY